MVNNRGHEINFDSYGEPTGNTTTLDKDNETISFFVANYDYDADKVYSELYECISMQANANPLLSRSREISFHFFDYQNEPRTFIYIENLSLDIYSPVPMGDMEDIIIGFKQRYPNVRIRKAAWNAVKLKDITPDITFFREPPCS